MPTTLMLVMCALKRRNGTCTKRNTCIFNRASTTFEMPFLHLFTNLNIFCISVKKQRLVDSLDLVMLCY